MSLVLGLFLFCSSALNDIFNPIFPMRERERENSKSIFSMGADRMLQDNIKIIKIAKKHIEEILYKLVVKK